MEEAVTLTLTKEERDMLMSSGHSKNDINEIVASLKKTTYFLKCGAVEKPLTPTEAIDILGRTEWAKGVARATFYSETTRWGLNDERVVVKFNNHAR